MQQEIIRKQREMEAQHLQKQISIQDEIVRKQKEMEAQHMQKMLEVQQRQIEQQNKINNQIQGNHGFNQQPNI